MKYYAPCNAMTAGGPSIIPMANSISKEANKHDDDGVIITFGFGTQNKDPTKNNITPSLTYGSPHGGGRKPMCCRCDEEEGG